MARPTTPPAWRRLFLRELARTGCVKLAADLCAVDRKTPYAARRDNPAFAASWQRALATARERPTPHAPPSRSASGRASLPGEGPGVGVRPGPGRLTGQAERAFLAELKATANVQAAARAAGVSTQAVYKRRRNRPAFAEQWRLALAEGRLRLEVRLIHVPTPTLDPEPRVEARETPEMTVDQALHLYRLHRASQRGGKPQRYAWRQQLPDIEEVRAEILRKVAAMEKAEGLQERE